MSFCDQTVVIIGGSSGIGLATARRVIAEGGHVVITGRRQNILDMACKELGGQATGIVTDALDDNATRALFEQIDKVDHIFSTAGTFTDDQNLQADDDIMRKDMESRFWSVVRAVKYGIPKMNKQGSVIFMSGTANRRPEGAPVGSASLGAVETFARSMAVQYAPIRFNCIAPGFTRTAFVESLLGDQTDEILESVVKRVPLGRLGSPDEVADAVFFLMNNGYVNGITLTVDGGYLLT